MTDAEKISFLTIEKESVRKEILLNIKILFSGLYSFLAVFAILLVFYYNKDNLDDSLIRSNVLFLIQQIEFIVLLFSIHLNSMIMTLAGYCIALEERINALSIDKISIWESVIVNRLVQRPTSIQSLSIFILNLIYLFVIIYLEFLIQEKEYHLAKEYNWTFLIIAVIESMLLVLMAYFLFKQKEKAYKLAIRNFKVSELLFRFILR